MKSTLHIRTTLATLIGLLVVTHVSSALGAVRWGEDILRQKANWYGSAEARADADNVLLYQSRYGAWPKNTDLLAMATPDALAEVQKGGKANTIDNGATILPMRFLAMVYHASHEERYRAAFIRGVNYLLDSQYPNGGFPQFYPLRGDKYYSHITFNDDAMSRALELLDDVAKKKSPYDLVDDPLRAKAAASVQRGIDCILKTQIRQNGKLTVWCAQYDQTTLKPAWARKYEPPSLSGEESVGIVRFLMSIKDPSPRIVSSIEGAVAWFKAVAIKGERLETIPVKGGRPDRRLVADPHAPLLWARFYELGTNRPLYVDRDSVFHYDFAKIGYERRSGYAYNGTWPASLLATAYPAWCKKHKLQVGK